MRLKDLIDKNQEKKYLRAIVEILEGIHTQVHDNGGLNRILINPAGSFQAAAVQFLLACDIIRDGFGKEGDARVFYLTEKGEKTILRVHESRLKKQKRKPSR